MANTYYKIATVTVGSGGSSSIDFSSIPSTYTDLMLNINARTSRPDYYTSFTNIRFNSSTSGYSYRNLVQQAANSPISQNSSSMSFGYLGYTNQTNNNSNVFSNLEVYIPNYTSSNYKSYSTNTVQEANDSTNNNMGFFSGLWSNTSSITSISLTAGAATVSDYNFLQYSIFTLYGIKNS